MQPNARQTVAGVLILTQVNFRVIITQCIPPVPYLTSIDKYAIGNLFFLILFACWHSIIGSQMFSNFLLDTRKEIDQYVLLSFGVAFICYTIAYMTWIVRMQKAIEKKKLNKNK